MNRVSLTISFLIATLVLNAQTPTFEWAKNMGGYYGYSRGISNVVDASGNLYTAGIFDGRVDFDPGPGNVFLTSTDVNNVFVTKMDASGNLIWAKQFPGKSIDISYSIAVNASGNVCFTGSFTGTGDFDPGIPVYNLTSNGGADIFIAMLDLSGDLIWARQIGGTLSENPKGIALDASNNVYATGYFTGTVDFDPGAAISNLSTLSNQDHAFILKLNVAGNFVFVKQFDGYNTRCLSINIDPAGNILTSGIFTSTADFDPGVGVYNLTATAGAAGAYDIFISKLNNAGNFLWAKLVGYTSHEEAKTIKTDASGNVYTAGFFSGTIDFNPGTAVTLLTSAGNNDLFILKLDSSGNYIWANKVGGNDNEDAKSVSIDADGNVYSIGSFKGVVDFNPGAGNFNLTSVNYGVYVLKLNSSGIFSWAKSIEASGYTEGNSIAIDSVGNNYATGCFTGFCDFDPGSGALDLVATAGTFLYTSKLDSLGNFVRAESGGSGASTFTKAMTTDPSGNIYTAGYFFGTIDFDPGPGVFNLSTAPTDIEGDVFVTKCNSSGNLVWARKMGGPELDIPTSIAVNSQGVVYTCGTFKGTVDFNPGPGIFNLTASSSNTDIFVSKLNASGNFVWAKKLGDSTAIEEVKSITLDPSGNIITAGKYNSGTNYYQLYLNKINPSGNIMWSKIFGGNTNATANSIKTDASGNIYYTGNFVGVFDFNPGAAIFNLSALPNYDAYVSKLDGGGNFIWAKQLEGQGYSYGISIAIDALNQIYIAGNFEDTTDFDPGSGVFNMISNNMSDVFILKLDNSGNFNWAKKFTGTNNDQVRSIAVDDAGGVYTTGLFNYTDFDPGPGTFYLSTVGSYDVFVNKLDANGDFEWAYRLGNLKWDQVHSISLDASANVYTCGTFFNTVDFDPGGNISNLASTGNPDLFIHKMSQCNPPAALITPGGPTSFCVGGSVTLNANTGTGLSYQWKRNGISIAGATSASYVVTIAGNYSVFVSDPQPCTSASGSIHVSVPCAPVDTSQQRTTFINDLISDDIKVFPNPTNGKIVIDAPPGQLQIFNAYGQLMSGFILQGGETSFDLSVFSDGIYLLQFKSEDKLFIRKIILNR